MYPRVSTHFLTNTFIERLQKQTSRLADLQDQLSSGRRLNRPDQDPAGFVELRLNEEQTANYKTFRFNVTTVTAKLNQSVSTLQDVNLILRRANEIAIEANNTSLDDDTREAYAVEIDGLLNQLFIASNTQIADEYIFSGTATNQKPFEITAVDVEGRPTAFAYRGGSEPTRTVVAQDRSVEVFSRGDRLFQQPSSDLFQALMDLRDTLRNTTLDSAARAQAMALRLEHLQRSQTVVLEQIGQQSGVLAALETLDNQLANFKLASEERVANLGNTDVIDASVRLRELENLYEATLGLTARIMQTSFLDFIR
jgi:flagellar hook-associated protein 3 FlgL